MSEIPPLPPELWVSVLSFLGPADMQAVRCSCRALRLLADHSYLWRGQAVVLSDLRRYTYGFWETLQRRKLTRVAVRHLRRKEWRRLVKFLPMLSAVAFVNGGRVYDQKYLEHLLHFADLRELAVRDAVWSGPMLSPALCLHLSTRLTHLSVCNISMPSAADFVRALAGLRNLRYLLFHQQGDGCGLDRVRPVPRDDFHQMMIGLPKLAHLSWGMRGEPQEPLPDDYLSPVDSRRPDLPYGGPALSSLELVDYPETILPYNALRSLTSLRSLTVRYSYIRDGRDCRLASWLDPLEHLETLGIVGENSLSLYTDTIPAGVTRLTLRVAITLKELDAIAPKVVALEHLDIEQNRSSGSLCRRIPMLFPYLKTLRIRFFRREPEKDLLNLQRLLHLERLELVVERSFILRDYMTGHLWPSPAVQELIDQLVRLSDNRIKVVTAMRRRDPIRECNCLWEGD
ncbi:uncharacterized protein LOC130922890 [Corythoichthys intestinalis]|uniref:uncharacterized protein LOC130922890 n=1 Tax=Corythoichthys intestinalis TaxID=161448 RepID=UPI0025A57E94|nr:uncharacterized protein LOC130922890 [Corythoichthys intestinalis]XP_057704116.1 uncharacterized protein LOC130922890 [Corythoichthys intestinalis]